MSLVVINQAAQQAGIVTSGTVALPIGGASINVSALMNAPDITTSGTTVGLSVLWSFDGLTFAEACGVTWLSGTYDQPGGGQGNLAPGVTMVVPNGVLAYQAQLNLAQPLNIGAAMTIVNLQGLPLPISVELKQV